MTDNKKQTWLNPRQAAEQLGVSVRTIKRIIAAGNLEYTRLPSPAGRGPIRIRINDLDALLARGIGR